MSKVYTSACCIIPPREKWAPIQEIRKNYDRQINRWMPHINLLYPFRPKKRFNKAENDISTICSQFKSFQISLKMFQYFEIGRQSLLLVTDDFLAVLQSDDCQDLTRRTIANRCIVFQLNHP